MAQSASIIELDQHRNRRLKTPQTPCPERLSPDQLRRLLELAMRSRFTEQEVRFAWNSVRMWWTTRRQPRTDWVAVTLNAMRTGWGLRGFQRWLSRTNQVPRTLTPQRIEALVAKQAALETEPQCE